MATRIEDYAIVGDCETTALISRQGSIDWLCFPRFDSPACFAALLGTPDHGRWSICPAGDVRETSRHYRDDTLILETDFETQQGRVTLVDFMPPRTEYPQIVRTVIGRDGQVDMRTEFVLRFNYGSVVPWVRGEDDGLSAIAGPDAVYMRSDVPLRGEDYHTVADFQVKAGQHVSFVLGWHRSYGQHPRLEDPAAALQRTSRWWKDWIAGCSYNGDWREAVVRSLITLKALIYAPTGGLVAAPTTSLPECLGGARNWDYRYCWLRDATFSLYSLIEAGHVDEARHWRDWLLRAVAGEPSQMQPLYGIDGQRWLDERNVDWLPGYENSRPVRVGNAACTQLQLDTYGEIMDVFHVVRRKGLDTDENIWQVQKAMLGHLESIWDQPDRGIWEIRGEPLPLTHSKAMAWVAFDRCVKAVEQFGLSGPVDKWRAIREKIHKQVCEQGFNSQIGAFVQSYGSDQLDASLLMLPLIGFLPSSDPRIRGTVDAIGDRLCRDGFVLRYQTDSGVDGLAHGEGAFLLCSFWLVDNLALLGRRTQACELYNRLLDLRNDVGLLAEEYSIDSGRLLGNFPQAFSHVALINSAINLSTDNGPASHRADGPGVKSATSTPVS